MTEAKIDLGAESGIDRDKLVQKVRKWNKADADRASSAAVTREDIGKFLEREPRVHKKALSWVRALDKMDEDKRADLLRSLDRILPMMREEWGQGQGDLFPEGIAPADPVDVPAQRMEADAAKAKASRERTSKRKGKEEPKQELSEKAKAYAETAPTRPDPDAAEFDDAPKDPDFDRHADEVFGASHVALAAE